MAIPMDGRSLRRERNRDLAVDALLDLLTEGVIRPTAQEVAERSGISLRSIFRIFDDVDTLHATAAARQLERNSHLFVELSTDGTLDERVDEVVEAHSRLYETISPVRRAGIRASAESRPLQEQLTRSRNWFRAEVERLFAAERPNADALAALEVALSWDAWDQLRSAQGLSVVKARRVVARTVIALLT